jgi:hypothetical protein
MAAYASRTENMDAIDTCVTGAVPRMEDCRAGIKLLDFKAFNPTDKRTEITYTVDATGEMKRATKGAFSSFPPLLSFLSRLTSSFLLRRYDRCHHRALLPQQDR